MKGTTQSTFENIMSLLKLRNFKQFLPSLYETEKEVLTNGDLSVIDRKKCRSFCTVLKEFVNDEDYLNSLFNLFKYVKKDKTKEGKSFYRFKDGVVYDYDFENLLLSLKSFAICVRAGFQKSMDDQHELKDYLTTIAENLISKAILNVEIEEMTTFEYVECALLKLLQDEFNKTIDKIEETLEHTQVFNK